MTEREDYADTDANLNDIADTLNVIVIIGLRIYDALMLANADRNPDATEALRQEHEAGRFVGDQPILSEDPFGQSEQQVNKQ